MGENRAEANLVWFLRNGYRTLALLSKTYTRFVLFCEKFRLADIEQVQIEEKFYPLR